MSQETPQFAQQEKKAEQEALIPVPMPKLMQECRELADIVLKTLESADEETKIRGKALFNRISLLENLLDLDKDKTVSNFEVTMQVWEIGKAATEFVRKQVSDDEKELFIQMLPIIEKVNHLLNGKAAAFIPITGSTYSGIDMSGGTPQTAITKVLSWGVKNRNGDTERKAFVR